MYIKNIEEKDPLIEGEQKLNINKTVAGAYGDMTRYFNFEINIKKPATLATETAYRAYVMEMVNSELMVVTAEENYGKIEASKGDGAYIEVKTGTPITIKLRHGQQLAFTGIHDGASYIVTEAAVQDYTASVVIKQYGVDQDVELQNGDPGTDRSTAPDDEQGLMLIVNGTGNKASFTNEYKDVSPLGIGTDNLPYILMIVMAAIAVAVYAVAKYRRNAEDEE